MTTVTVYGRPGCHLCQDAIDLLEALRSDSRSFEIVEINIEESLTLHAAYLERIPVIEIGGQVISELVPNPDTLGRSLDTLGT